VWPTLLFLGAGLELLDALLVAGDFGTRYERPTDRLLVWSEVAGASVVLLAALAVILRKKLRWGAVLVLQLLGAALQILPIQATRASIAEAVHRGGDWGAVSILSHQASLLLEFVVTGLCIATAGYLIYRRKADASTSS
jgi:hypothetical protein